MLACYPWFVPFFCPRLLFFQGAKMVCKDRSGKWLGTSRLALHDDGIMPGFDCDIKQGMGATAP